MKLKGKYKSIKKELLANGISCLNGMPCSLYVALATLKGYAIPPHHVPYEEDAIKSLKWYVSTNGDFKEIPIHETGKSKSQRRQESGKAIRGGSSKEQYAALAIAFLQSRAWRELRYAVLKERGAVCECCGASAKTGAVIHVDHIKPRVKYPELVLVKSNLQVLCEDCNFGKGWRDETDWRIDREYQSALDRDQ